MLVTMRNEKVTISGKVDTSKIGNYTITYTAVDKAGNKAVATRKIKVYDNIPPIITLNGPVSIYINQNEKYTDAGATATDNHDRSLKLVKTITFHESNKKVKVNKIDTSKLGVYYITYTTTDESGNRSLPVTRNVFIMEKTKPGPDTRKPRITLNGNFRWKDSHGQLQNFYPRQQLTGTYIEPGATAVDDRDGKVPVKISYGKLTKSLFRAGKPGSQQGIYVVFYTAKDKAGNKSVKYRLVLKDLAAWYPSSDYEVEVSRYIKAHFNEF